MPGIKRRERRGTPRHKDRPGWLKKKKKERRCIVSREACTGRARTTRSPPEPQLLAERAESAQATLLKI
ncbi:hypothetical protein MTO96_014877 [Rhipicephalus appendiculatus]